MCFINLLSETSRATFLLGVLFHDSSRVSVICIWKVILCYLYPTSLFMCSTAAFHMTSKGAIKKQILSTDKYL